MRVPALARLAVYAATAGVFLASAVWYTRRHPVRYADGIKACEALGLHHPMVAAGSSLAVLYKRVESPYMGPIAEALKDMLGIGDDRRGKVAEFMKVSKLDKADVRWGLFSVEAVSVHADGTLERKPRCALALSFEHDIADILAAFEAVRGPDSPLSFEEMPPVEGVPAWRVKARGWDTESGTPDASAVIASLDGEILFIVSDADVLGGQIRLYRDGQSEDVRFRTVSSGGRDAFRVFVPNLGRFIEKAVPNPKEALADFNLLFPDGAAAVLALGELDLAVSPGEKSGLKIRLSLRTASPENADAISSIVKAIRIRSLADAKRAAERDGADEWAKSVCESLKGLTVTEKNGIISVVIPVSDASARRAATAVLACLGI